MTTKSENKKILIVVVLFIVLLLVLVVIRAKRSESLKTLKENSGEQKVELIVTPTIDPSNGVIRITPSKTSIKLGEQSTFTVEIEAGGKQLDGSDVVLRFDPALFEVIDITPGEYFSQYPRKTIDNVGGSVKVTSFSPNVREPLSESQQLFSFLVKGKKIGTGSIRIEFEKGKTNKSNLVEHKTSKNVLGRVEDAMMTVNE